MSRRAQRLSRSAAESSADRLPEIPGYDILMRLASGGMGIVYQARHRRLDRIVAIKVLRPDHLSHPGAVARFRREARAAARLEHPNIVRIFDADQAGDVPYLVMEYVDGLTLAALVGRQGPLPMPTACEYIRQAACGLAHAHEQGLVHRDIKPSNLMVSGGVVSGEWSNGTTHHSPLTTHQIKLLDLGLVRLHGRTDASVSSLTQAGQVLGTPDYVAPEQIEAPQTADIRADLYSLGCTAYFLLTGQPPFPGAALVQKLDGHRWGKPVPLRERRPDVPREVAVIVERLMAKRPEDRYRLPADLAADLQRVLSTDGLPVPCPIGARDTDIHGSFGTAVTVPQVDRPVAASSDSRRLGTEHGDWITTVAFAPDGRHLLAGSRDGSFSVWDFQDGREVGHSFHADAVLCAAWTPDGSHIVSGGRDGTLRLWDIADGREVLRCTGHAGAVHGVAAAADGRWLLSGGKDQTVRLWNRATGREVRRIGGAVAERHWDAVLSVVMTADGRWGLSGGRDRTLHLWDLATGSELRCLRDHGAPVASVAVTTDGRRALAASGCVVQVWDLDSGALTGRLDGHTRPITSVALSPSDRLAVSGSEDHSVRLWDLGSGRELCCLGEHAGWVLSVAFAPDGRQVASGGVDRAVYRWPVPEDIG